MPREAVYGVRHFGAEAAESAEPDQGGTPIVDVRWHKEAGMVQVVSRLNECEVWVPPDTGTTDSMPPATYGYYVDLDWQAINALIRNLRRARDAVFGRPE